MAFSRTWDPSYEAAPADTDDISNDAEVARNLKIDIRERLEADHSMDADDDDGKHKHVTLLDQGSDPSFAASEVGIYNNGGTLKYTPAGGSPQPLGFESGTTMLFYQASPPTGWTQDNTVNDRVIRIVDNTGTGAATGGSWTISGVTVDGHSLTVNEMPSHNHGGSTQNSNISAVFSEDGTSFDGDPGKGLGGFAETETVNGSSHSHGIVSNGGNSPHNHGLTADGSWRPSYVNVIAASKD